MSIPKKIVDYYILIYKPRHSRAVGEGYVYEQVLVAEKQLGRSLTPDEDVRHINGDTQDNRPSNLEIVSTNIDYRAQAVDGNTGPLNRKSSRVFMPCKFQRECWKTIRGPIAKKEKVYLPYICSFQDGGDIYKCSHFWNFVEKDLEEQKKSV